MILVLSVLIGLISGAPVDIKKDAPSVSALQTQLDTMQHDLSVAVVQSEKPAVAAQERPAKAKAKAQPPSMPKASEEIFVEDGAPAGKKNQTTHLICHLASCRVEFLLSRDPDELSLGGAMAAVASGDAAANADKNDMTLMMMWGGAAGAGIALLVLFAVCSVTTTKCLLRIVHNTATSITTCFKAMGSVLLDCTEAVMGVITSVAEWVSNTWEDVTTWLYDTCCSCC